MLFGPSRIALAQPHLCAPVAANGISKPKPYANTCLPKTHPRRYSSGRRLVHRPEKGTRMTNLGRTPPPGERHYAQLLAALCRSARDKPLERRLEMMSGVARSLVGNSEPERTGITHLVLLELSGPDAQELSDLIARGGAPDGAPTGTAPQSALGRRERRRNHNGGAWSTPWLAARERRRRP